MNDKIYNWLKGFPGLELMQRQQVDAVPGGSGLFFCGVTALDGTRDLLGGTRNRKKLRFRLCRYGNRQESPIFFLMLGSWVEANAQQLGADYAATHPQQLGADHAAAHPHSLGSDYTAALKNARCVRDTDSGLALWEADLEITYWEEL